MNTPTLLKLTVTSFCYNCGRQTEQIPFNYLKNSHPCSINVCTKCWKEATGTNIDVKGDCKVLVAEILSDLKKKIPQPKNNGVGVYQI